MEDWFYSLTPAIVTIVTNIVFYYFVKGRIQNSFEQKNIIFQGLFQEKIKINRELLEKINKVSDGIYMFNLESEIKDLKELRNNFQSLIYYNMINQPFWSTSTLKQLNLLNKEFESILKLFGDFIIAKEESIYEENPTLDNVNKRFKPFIVEITREPLFHTYINSLVVEMREDMRVNVFNKKK
ncbi:hypothetical protein RM549_06065 [Salegentibacter sp. F188]|uniref:ATP synthase F0 subunit b n=1 Tax=Autumnicola patrickiae TaxID=3075591 RepID=A0ABU3E064_9FLAO|nr:hypothetical protein [Salegentibacter sp. F188]MDT0689342.1 hypothetical protein [Salegentibacter sp. F188]